MISDGGQYGSAAGEGSCGGRGDLLAAIFANQREGEPWVAGRIGGDLENWDEFVRTCAGVH